MNLIKTSYPERIDAGFGTYTLEYNQQKKYPLTLMGCQELMKQALNDELFIDCFKIYSNDVLIHKFEIAD